MLISLSIVFGLIARTWLTPTVWIRITFEGLPIILSAILFGPIVGAMVGAASDLTAFALVGQGTWIPLLTVGAASLGLISGLISRYIVKKDGMLKFALCAGVSHLFASTFFRTYALFITFGRNPVIIWSRVPTTIGIAIVEFFILYLLFKNSELKQIFTEFTTRKPKTRKIKPKEQTHDL